MFSGVRSFTPAKENLKDLDQMYTDPAYAKISCSCIPLSQAIMMTVNMLRITL